MENRGEVKSGCKGVLVRDSGRNSGVRALGRDSGRTGSVRTLELNSGRTERRGRSEGASDACVFLLMKSRRLHLQLQERLHPRGQIPQSQRKIQGGQNRNLSHRFNSPRGRLHNGHLNQTFLPFPHS